MISLPPRWLALVLKTVGVVTTTAFGAAVMPQAWIVSIATALGFEPFPDSPLTFYLARNLSLMYGFIGLLVLAIAIDLERYRSVVKPLAMAIILFGVCQAIVDVQAGMPTWWTGLESLSTILGGAMIAWLDRVSTGGHTGDR